MDLVPLSRVATGMTTRASNGHAQRTRNIKATHCSWRLRRLSCLYNMALIVSVPAQMPGKRSCVRAA